MQVYLVQGLLFVLSLPVREGTLQLLAVLLLGGDQTLLSKEARDPSLPAKCSHHFSSYFRGKK